MGERITHRETKTYFEINKNENRTCQNFQATDKALPIGNFRFVNAYIISQINNLKFNIIKQDKRRAS